MILMAVVVGNTARNLLGLQRTITCGALAGKWLQNQLSTSAKLSQTSESSGGKNTKIYEMRTYYVKPKAFGKEIFYFQPTVWFSPPKIITELKGIRSGVCTCSAMVRKNTTPTPLRPSPAPAWQDYLQQFWFWSKL